MEPIKNASKIRSWGYPQARSYPQQGGIGMSETRHAAGRASRQIEEIQFLRSAAAAGTQAQPVLWRFRKLVWTLHGRAAWQLESFTMAMDGVEIERLIKQAFPDAQVVVVDLRGDGDHYGARVTSEAFLGKSRIQQHKMVYDALQGQMGGALHALALETAVPK